MSDLEGDLGASGEIESAIAGGQVFVQQGERQATSDEALLNAISGELVLTGNPVVREMGARCGESESPYG